MIIEQTGFSGLLILKPRVFEDERGYFFESFNQQKFEENNLQVKFVQDNQSKSSFGVIRGLHYQLNPHAQAKLIRVLSGEILDVVVDIRKNSPTFGKVYSIQLSDTNFLQLFIPKGFAHGFSVLSEKAIILYKCDSLYNKDAESGIIYNDSSLNIDWRIPESNQIISEKDKKLLPFHQAEMNF